MAKLPPPPIRDKFGSYTWEDWFRKVRASLTTAGSLAWTLLDFTGSTLTNIVDRKHNDLQNIQGGASAEYYHLKSSEQSKVSRLHVVEYQAPSTGFSITPNNTTGVLVLKPSGTLATGTITMPSTPINEQTLTVTSTQVVTALTMNPNTGQTLQGGLTTITANGFATWIYRTTDTTWYRIG